MDNYTFEMFYDVYWTAVYQAAYKRLNDPVKASALTRQVFEELRDCTDKASVKDALMFLLRCIQSKVHQLKIRECTEIVYPPLKIFNGTIVTYAN